MKIQTDYEMNTKQLRVMWGAIAIVVIMCIYPPFVYKNDSGRIADRGYKFITSQRGYIKINTPRLAIQLFIVGVLAAGVIVTLRTKNKDETDKSSGNNKNRSMLDEVQDTGGKLIVSGYRRIGSQQQTAPTAETSDDEIIAIYKQVVTAFSEAASTRGEHLAAENLNYIAWKFLVVKEKMGTEMFYEHLKYEVNKYHEEGLREDYKQELSLF